MAENNIQVVIPEQENAETLVALLVDVFAKASGMTADENNTFWIERDVLGIRIKADGSSVNVSAVRYDSAETTIAQFGYADETVFIYNKSASGKTFAFGFYYSNTANKHLNIAIATDDAGVTRLIVVLTNGWKLFSPGITETTISATSNEVSTFVTLVKLPAIHSRTTFADLYQIYAMPDASFGTDSSLYAGGRLYKIMTSTSSNLGLAFRVA